jgi:prophage regulatory protein
MSDQPDRILRITAVLDRTGLTRSTLYRKIADGSFPSQVRLNTRCVGWRESSVAKWLSGPYGYRAENDNDDPHGKAGHGEG